MAANFFGRVDDLGIVDQHIKEVLKLEHSEALKVLRGYEVVRSDLINNLNKTRAGTFSHQHLIGTLAQVQGAILAITADLEHSTKKAAFRAAKHGVENMLKELSLFRTEFEGAVTPINLNAVLVAQDTANLLVSRYKTNLQAYGSDLMNQIQIGLTTATIGQTTAGQVVDRISSFFTDEEWKLHRIVRTELHGVYNRAKINGMQEIADDYIPDMKKTLIQPMDGRTGADSIYAATLGLVADIDKPFVYYWPIGKKARKREFFAPPDRPNDRSVCVPYRAEWGRAGNSGMGGKFPAA